MILTGWTISLSIAVESNFEITIGVLKVSTGLSRITMPLVLANLLSTHSYAPTLHAFALALTTDCVTDTSASRNAASVQVKQKVED